MMAKTHLTIGVASALLILHPTTPEGCLFAIAGGALGGVAADIDAVKNDYKHDALIGQFLAYGMVTLSLLFDLIFDWGICRSFVDNGSVKIAGIIGYVVVLIIGFCSKHRTFTHSIFAAVLFSLSLVLLYPQIVLAFAIGYISHLILDITNKKDVPILYPFVKKGICLKWCYASKTANTVMLWVGLVVSLVLVFNTVVYEIW